MIQDAIIINASVWNERCLSWRDNIFQHWAYPRGNDLSNQLEDDVTEGNVFELFDSCGSLDLCDEHNEGVIKCFVHMTSLEEKTDIFNHFLIDNVPVCFEE